MLPDLTEGIITVADKRVALKIFDEYGISGL
jgi:hypothetical protein